MSTNSTLLKLVKPTVSGDSDVWGGYLNTTIDSLDKLLNGVATTGSANAYVLTTGQSLTTYQTGETYKLIPNFSNTGAATLNRDGAGAKNLYKLVSGTPTALASGDVPSGVPIIVMYDGTQFVILSASTNQPLDATLTALAGLTTGTNNYIRSTGTDAFTMDSYATVLSNIAAAASARVLTAGTGLTGGGDLSADRTFTVDLATAAQIWAGTANKVLATDKLVTAQAPTSITCNATSTVTITIASPAVVSWTSHGLVAGQPVVFTTTGALPTGLTAGTTYYVISAGLTANAFEVSATRGGAAVNTSGTQSGTHTATPWIYIDLALGVNFYITLTRNVTFDVPQNGNAGQSGIVEIIQDGTGSRTGAWNSSWGFAGGTDPTLTTTASAVDILSFYKRQGGDIVASLGIKAPS